LPPHKNLARRVLDDDAAEGHAEGVFLQDAWSTMISKLEPVITENVLKTVSGSDFTAQDIMCGKKPVSLYLRWPEAHVDALAPLIRLVWSTLFDDFKTIYDDRKGEGCREILAILDEAGRAPVPKLPEYASTVLGRKITLWIAYQSRSQPEKIYGTKGADELFDNIDSILYYRPAIGNYKSSAQMQEALGFHLCLCQIPDDPCGPRNLGRGERAENTPHGRVRNPADADQPDRRRTCQHRLFPGRADELPQLAGASEAFEA
jgi:hypothetical protein